MDTVDKAEPKLAEPKKRGPKPKAKVDRVPMAGQFYAEQAAKEKQNAVNNEVVESYYELVSGHKLLLIKKKRKGGTRSTFVGSLNNKKHGPRLREFIKNLQAEGRLKTRI
jgi:hypothetical protein